MADIVQRIYHALTEPSTTEHRLLLRKTIYYASVPTVDQSTT